MGFYNEMLYFYDVIQFHMCMHVYFALIHVLYSRDEKCVVSY